MTNTGERRPIIQQVNANEAEAVRESKLLVAKTDQAAASTGRNDRQRNKKTLKKKLDNEPHSS
jgi:hypothetical protein